VEGRQDRLAVVDEHLPVGRRDGLPDRGQLRVKLEEARPQRSTGNDIQDYLAAQRKNLEARAARQQMIRESGINLKELASNLKAPIDAARARRNTRGG
jgi:uncharacterized protein YdbL (DUF1318 family)